MIFPNGPCSFISLIPKSRPPTTFAAFITGAHVPKRPHNMGRGRNAVAVFGKTMLQQSKGSYRSMPSTPAVCNDANNTHIGASNLGHLSRYASPVRCEIFMTHKRRHYGRMQADVGGPMAMFSRVRKTAKVQRQMHYPVSNGLFRQIQHTFFNSCFGNRWTSTATTPFLHGLSSNLQRSRCRCHSQMPVSLNKKIHSATEDSKIQFGTCSC